MMLLVSDNAFKAIAKKNIHPFDVVVAVEAGNPAPSGLKVITMKEFVKTADTLETRYAARSCFTHVLMVA